MSWKEQIKSAYKLTGVLTMPVYHDLPGECCDFHVIKGAK